MGYLYPGCATSRIYESHLTPPVDPAERSVAK